MAIEVHSARPAELGVPTVYAVLKLRVDVFVVEQECAYPELDGRDLEPDALWVWATDDAGGADGAGGAGGAEVVATLRVLTEPDGTRRIGRVATAPSARSGGVASALMRRALEECGGQPVVLDAQSYLENWYARFGFTKTGEEFLDDGIPHIPMALSR